jgi:hypothetical protein
MMRPVQKAIIPLLLLSALLECAAYAGQEPASWEEYRVVVAKNIFVRNRSSRREEGPVRQPAPPPPAERYIVVRGAVQQGKESLAFLEDVRTGTTSVLRAGDAVASGHLTTITLDYVEYESDGVTRTVKIGQNLEADVPSPMSLSASSEAVGSSPVPLSGMAEGEPTSEAAATIMERLRQRRQEQVGR